MFDILFISVTLLVGLLFLNQTVGLILKRTTVWAQHNSVFEHLDFVSFYACGMMILKGQAKDIYDIGAQLAAYNAVISPASVPYTNFLQHVPYVFVFLPLLALLPLRTAYLAWSAFSALCALVGTYTFRKLNNAGKLDTLLLGLIMLSSLPGNFCLLDGQLSWFYFALLSVYCLSFLKNHHTICGISLALLSIKPQYFLFLLVPQIVLKQKKTLLVTACTIAALIALACVFVGWENVLRYPQVLWHGESTEHFALERPKTMISVRSVMSILFPNKTALIGCFLFELLGLGLTIFAWKKARSNTSNQTSDSTYKRDCLIFTLLITLVVSAHFYLYEGVLLAAPLLLALPSWRPSVCMAAGRKESPNKSVLYLLLLLFPLANMTILLATPAVASIILPQAILDATEDNGIKGNLLMYVALFAYNVAIAAASAHVVFGRKSS